MVCNTNSSIQSKINVIGSVSGAQLTFEFTQASHGFKVGDVIRYDDAYAGFTLAQADTSEHSEVTGVVREISGDHIFLTTEGVIPIDGFTFARSADRSTSVSGYTASAYFLSGQTAGLLDTAPPKQGGYVVKPTVVNMGAIGGRQYGMIKNYVGNQIGGNASASVHGISPVGSIVPFIGYENRVPAGFTTCAGGFISPSKYPEYNNHIGGKFGYKIRIGITGDTPYKRHQFMTALNTSMGDVTGSTETGRPRFRQEFPGIRQGNGVTSGNFIDDGSKMFVLQGDVVGVSVPGEATVGGPYYIDVEITQDNQVDLPRILWAEKYGNETYITETAAKFGRHGLGTLSVPDYEIRSSFMANYNMEEATTTFDAASGLALGALSRTKIFRQDNTGSHGLESAGGFIYDESVYNSYTQESPGHGNAYKRLHGNAAETPTPRNLNTTVFEHPQGAYTNPYYGDSQVVGPPGSDNAISSVVNYDSHSPANEREIVSYISATIGAPLPYFTANPSDDYTKNVRTYIIKGNVSYDDLNKRIGGVNGDPNNTNLKEYEDYFKIAQTNDVNLAWRPSGSLPGHGGAEGTAASDDHEVLLLNTTNAGGTDDDGTGNKIDFISITGVRVPDLRDRYLKGKAEPAEFYGSTPLDTDELEKDAYAVMNDYSGGVGLRGGTNRTHSQKLLSASHVASPATHTQEEHLMNWHEMGIASFDLSDDEYDNSNSWYDFWAKTSTPGAPTGGDLDWSWAPIYRFREWWNWNSYDTDTADNGALKRAKGMNVTQKSTGYNRIFGDDGLYNMSGFYQWDCDANGDCDNLILPFNRDRYHRVDTPGIVTDTVSTPQVLRTDNGTPHDDGGAYVGTHSKDDLKNHKDYQVIDRDAQYEDGTIFGIGVGAYNPVMSIDPLFIKAFDGVPWSDDPDQDDHIGKGFFGKDFETFAYITNEPKYMTVNWLVRIEDDTSVALVDDTTFRKLNCDGINDDGSLISGQDLSPLTLTNVPVAADAGDLPVGSVYRDGTDLKIKT